MKQPMQNPYDCTSSISEISNRRLAWWRLLPPATLLVGLTVLTPLFLFVVFRFATVSYSFQRGKTGDSIFQMLLDYAEPIAANLIANMVVTYAAIQMLCVRQRTACLLGAVIAMVPILSPGYFMGIPFGLWALIILLRKDTHAAFAESH